MAGSAAGADLPALQHPPWHWWSFQTRSVLGEGGLLEAGGIRLEAIASRLEALGRLPSLVGWRLLLVGGHCQ